MLDIRREKIDEILAGVVWSNWPERPKGGQQVNRIPTGVKLTHPDWSFEVCCGEYRTQMQNKTICLQLFELFLMSL